VIWDISSSIKDNHLDFEPARIGTGGSIVLGRQNSTG
jgi:hypothetical protein